MFPDFLCSIIQPQQLRSGDTPKDVSLLCCSLSSRWKIAHRPKYKATESKYRAYLQAYRQRWNTTQLLTAHISASLSAQTARPYTNQNKLSLVNQEIDCSKVSTPKEKRSPSNRGTLEPFKNHNQMESKTPWLDVRGQTPHLLSWEVTPLFLKPKVESIGGKNENVYDPLPQSNVSQLQDTTFFEIPTH